MPWNCTSPKTQPLNLLIQTSAHIKHLSLSICTARLSTESKVIKKNLLWRVKKAINENWYWTKENLKTNHALWLLSSHFIPGGFPPFQNWIHVTHDSNTCCNMMAHMWPQTECPRSNGTPCVTNKAQSPSRLQLTPADTLTQTRYNVWTKWLWGCWHCPRKKNDSSCCCKNPTKNKFICKRHSSTAAGGVITGAKEEVTSGFYSLHSEEVKADGWVLDCNVGDKWQKPDDDFICCLTLIEPQLFLSTEQILNLGLKMLQTSLI